MPKPRTKKDPAHVHEKYNLDKKDQILIRQITEFPSTPVRELADMLGISSTAIKNRMNKPSFRKAFAELSQSTDEALKALAHIAIQRVKKLLASSDEKIALEACKLALNQYTNRFQVDVTSVQEVIYRTRFGEQGQLISEREDIPAETPTNTLELLRYQ